jgi:hypothetical protein
MSAALLGQISQKLSDCSNNCAQDPPDISEMFDIFEVQPSNILVNVFWFTSLVLNLGVAVLGIFLKQLIRTYLKWTEVMPEQKAVALRHDRYSNLVAWKLDSILAALPIILQAAVVLYLIGLVILLWSTHRIVAQVMTALIGVKLILVITLILLPVFQPVSSLSEHLVHFKWYLVHLKRYMQSSYRHEDGDEALPTTSNRLQPSLTSSWKNIDALCYVPSTTQSQDVLVMALSCAAAEARSKEDYISYNDWLTITIHILDPNHSLPLGGHLAKSDDIRRRVRLLSEKVQMALLYFHESCFIPQMDNSISLSPGTGFRFAQELPESIHTIIAILAGMDDVPGSTRGRLARILIYVVEASRSAGIRCSDEHIQAILHDFCSLFQFMPTSSLGNHRLTSAEETMNRQMFEWYCNSLEHDGPRGAEWQLFDIVFQLSLVGVQERHHSDLLSRVRDLDSEAQSNATIIIRPSAQALLALARSELENFPKRLARGICQLVGEPFNYDGLIPDEDWKRILDHFEIIINDEDWWWDHWQASRIGLGTVPMQTGEARETARVFAIPASDGWSRAGMDDLISVRADI